MCVCGSMIITNSPSYMHTLVYNTSLVIQESWWLESFWLWEIIWIHQSSVKVGYNTAASFGQTNTKNLQIFPSWNRMEIYNRYVRAHGSYFYYCLKMCQPSIPNVRMNNAQPPWHGWLASRLLFMDSGPSRLGLWPSRLGFWIIHPCSWPQEALWSVYACSVAIGICSWPHILALLLWPSFW